MDAATVYLLTAGHSHDEQLMHSNTFREPSQMNAIPSVYHPQSDSGPPSLYNIPYAWSQRPPDNEHYHAQHPHTSHPAPNMQQQLDAANSFPAYPRLSQVSPCDSSCQHCEPCASVQRIRWPPTCASDASGFESTNFSETCGGPGLCRPGEAGCPGATALHEGYEYDPQTGYVENTSRGVPACCSRVVGAASYAGGRTPLPGYYPENGVEAEFWQSRPHLAQHVPVAPHHYSSYSELSANVTFFSEMALKIPVPSTPPSAVAPQAHGGSEYLAQAQYYQHEQAIVGRDQPHPWFEARSKPVVIPLPSPDSPPATGFPDYPSGSTSHELPSGSSSSRRSSPSASPASSHGPPTPPPSAARLRTLSVRKANAKEAKRPPSLACFFCRERKIACGRPAPGSANPACNQCRRRSNQCEYPKECLRGQHRRGTGKNGASAGASLGSKYT
ncbi:hypothetical protein LshimejAT787_2300820 [Lyophyllum shimeji]|uniref:Zn(2)-C6 fungal-type domain-containing protein n=1 Tax=Lyophyllum shimeji TaxID=47721 RepID=A0A9P3UUV0_LYOSH|nr:hypothetical protein LshimejAT787_2300820 [Lyophyllum shimeji]